MSNIAPTTIEGDIDAINLEPAKFTVATGTFDSLTFMQSTNMDYFVLLKAFLLPLPVCLLPHLYPESQEGIIEFCDTNWVRS